MGNETIKTKKKPGLALPLAILKSDVEEQPANQVGCLAGLAPPLELLVLEGLG